MRGELSVVEVGQEIYVTRGNRFMETTPNLDTWIVTSVNTKSFYAHIKGTVNGQRFDKRSMVCELLNAGEYLRAYQSPSLYWDKVAEMKRVVELKSIIQKELVGMNLKVLEEIYKVIEKSYK